VEHWVSENLMKYQDDFCTQHDHKWPHSPFYLRPNPAGPDRHTGNPWAAVYFHHFPTVSYKIHLFHLLGRSFICTWSCGNWASIPQDVRKRWFIASESTPI
jgi:hypothetical protein